MAASTDDVDWQALVVDDVGAQLEEKEISDRSRGWYTTWYGWRSFDQQAVGKKRHRRFLTVLETIPYVGWPLVVAQGIPMLSRRLMRAPAIRHACIVNVSSCVASCLMPPPLVRGNFARMAGNRARGLMPARQALARDGSRSICTSMLLSRKPCALYNLVSSTPGCIRRRVSSTICINRLTYCALYSSEYAWKMIIARCREHVFVVNVRKKPLYSGQNPCGCDESGPVKYDSDGRYLRPS